MLTKTICPAAPAALSDALVVAAWSPLPPHPARARAKTSAASNNTAPGTVSLLFVAATRAGRADMPVTP
ncbi:MAG: hypothetical protein M5U27_12630 [Gaiella sp.]|nr:hypothetical protein [Gaiella sp.]